MNVLIKKARIFQRGNKHHLKTRDIHIKNGRVLKISAVDWADKMKLGYFSKTEAWTVLHINISDKQKYPLSACILTEDQCKSTMSSAIRATLLDVEISSNIVT